MMINSKVPATKATHKNLKKADPIATFKNSILIVSVVGTMQVGSYYLIKKPIVYLPAPLFLSALASQTLTS